MATIGSVARAVVNKHPTQTNIDNANFFIIGSKQKDCFVSVLKHDLFIS
jgi:hypothetical protein